jgi:hypothetical protein
MKVFIKIFLFILVILLLKSSYWQTDINYNKYIKKIYNVPSYESIIECYKTDFYDDVFKQINNQLIDKLIIKHQNYKTKLDNIIIYI